jgi:hypothetical protein
MDSHLPPPPFLFFSPLRKKKKTRLYSMPYFFCLRTCYFVSVLLFVFLQGFSTLFYNVRGDLRSLSLLWSLHHLTQPCCPSSVLLPSSSSLPLFPPCVLLTATRERSQWATSDEREKHSRRCSECWSANLPSLHIFTSSFYVRVCVPFISFSSSVLVFRIRKLFLFVVIVVASRSWC